jgi:hypothetical protein
VGKDRSSASGSAPGPRKPEFIVPEFIKTSDPACQMDAGITNPADSPDIDTTAWTKPQLQNVLDLALTAPPHRLRPHRTPRRCPAIIRQTGRRSFDSPRAVDAGRTANPSRWD